MATSGGLAVGRSRIWPRGIWDSAEFRGWDLANSGFDQKSQVYRSQMTRHPPQLITCGVSAKRKKECGAALASLPKAENGHHQTTPDEKAPGRCICGPQQGHSKRNLVTNYLQELRLPRLPAKGTVAPNFSCGLRHRRRRGTWRRQDGVIAAAIPLAVEVRQTRYF